VAKKGPWIAMAPGQHQVYNPRFGLFEGYKIPPPAGWISHEGTKTLTIISAELLKCASIFLSALVPLWPKMGDGLP
jgi:hypothetical protein